MEHFLSFLKTHLDPGAVEMALLQFAPRTRTYTKGQIILEADRVHHEINFLESGLVRGYIPDESGRDTTWHFYFNDAHSHMTNLFVIDYHSLISGEHSRIQFEAVTDCVICSLPYSSIGALHLVSKKWVLFSLKMADLAYSFVHRKYMIQLTGDAETRYRMLLEDMPHLFDLFPHYQIASYIGISPQHLSRIRKAHEPM